MNCGAFLSLCVSDGLLMLKKMDFIHSHSLQGISPWVYHKNRRLTKEQTEVVHSLMRSPMSTREILIYIKEQFNRKLNRFDLRRIRDKLRGGKLSDHGLDVLSPDKQNGIVNESYSSVSFDDTARDRSKPHSQYADISEVCHLDYLGDVFTKNANHFTNLDFIISNELNWSDLQQNFVHKLSEPHNSSSSEEHDLSIFHSEPSLLPSDKSRLIRHLLKQPR